MKRLRLSTSQLSRMISEVAKIAESDVIDFMSARRRKDIEKAQQPLQRAPNIRTSPNAQFIVRFPDRPIGMMRTWLRNEIENRPKPKGALWELGVASHDGSTAAITNGDRPNSLRVGLKIEPKKVGWELPSDAELQAQDEVFNWLQEIVDDMGAVEYHQAATTSNADAARRLQQILDGGM